MAYRIEKEDGGSMSIVWSGFENGVAFSPLKGNANIKNANIATETGQVMAGYGRAQQSMTSTSSSGTLSFLDSTHVDLSISGANNKFKGMWISVSSSSHTGELANGTYWVTRSTGSGFQLATTYEGSAISGYTAGLTATISLVRTMGRAVAYGEETFFLSGARYNRFYVLDHQGLVWMYDTQYDISFYDSDDVRYWVLPDTSVSYWGSDTTPSGVGVLNGWLIVLSGNKFWVKPTVKLDTSYVQMTNALMMSQPNSQNPHFALQTHQGRLYYTDGTYVGSIFPDTSLEVSGLANVQSYATWTTSGSATNCVISNLHAGSVPSDGNITSVRVPVVFFTATGGALPSSISANTVYYIEFAIGTQAFGVYDAASGGAAKDMSAGRSGTQYYNTFYPVGTHAGAGGDHTTMIFSNTRLNLPIFETAKTLGEVGNTILVGCYGAVVYPWNQVDVTPTSLINLPEANVSSILTVNQFAYIFAGYKANVYVTDGSTASLALKVPDYCAGIEGTVGSYFEPTFTWGGTAYIRGRVYFSVLDQTSTKAGNCGGVWSFYPTQNLAYGQDTGLALRLENQNSYGTYSGYATVLIPNPNQNVKSPQYWSCWQSAVSSPTYGIDTTTTTPVGTVVVETDLVPTGTLLQKRTFTQLEYKLAAPLTAGEAVSLKWRLNGSAAFAATDTVIAESTADIAGYVPVNFQQGQWLQLQATLTPTTAPNDSKIQLIELRARFT